MKLFRKKPSKQDEFAAGGERCTKEAGAYTIALVVVINATGISPRFSRKDIGGIVSSLLVA
jgi:hypothetical protein